VWKGRRALEALTLEHSKDMTIGLHIEHKFLKLNNINIHHEAVLIDGLVYSLEG
jgi:hypothetical protein